MWDRMLFSQVAEGSARLAATGSRLAKRDVLVELMRAADPSEVPVLLPMLAGRLRQRRTGLGWVTAARHGVTPAATATLSVSDVDHAFEVAAAAGGEGSATARASVWRELLGRATEAEQQLLVGLVTGNVRQGAADGLLTEAVAHAAGVPVDDVRRALMLAGDIVAVGVAALVGGSEALSAFRLTPGTGVSPMLAQSAPDVGAALARTGPALVEWKLDGVRLQAHARDGRIRLFSRSLDDVTARMPDVAATVAALGRDCVLDGEVLLVGDDGRPRPFQETASRSARGAAAGLSYAVFDVLHLDGRALVDEPLAERRRVLTSLVPDLATAGGPWVGLVRTPALDVLDPLVPVAAEEFASGALAAGHEGVVVKSLDSAYAAGRRGAAWVKVKPVETLDLVVLAVEWGSGRRRGLLSNLHLGARDPGGDYGPPGGYVMLGKTFKGLTDAMLTWQTDALSRLRTDPGHEGEWVVHVRPELVVEIALDGVQTSPRYPAGMALRFARVVRHRPDKRAEDADTVDAVRRLHRRG